MKGQPSSGAARTDINLVQDLRKTHGHNMYDRNHEHQSLKANTIDLPLGMLAWTGGPSLQVANMRWGCSTLGGKLNALSDATLWIVVMASGSLQTAHAWVCKTLRGRGRLQGG